MVMGRERRVLITGASGLVGSRVVEILEPNGFEFVKISRKKGIDITDKDSLEDVFKNFEGKWVLHLAAKTDVDGCEKDKGGDVEKLGGGEVLDFSIDEISESSVLFRGMNSAWAVNLVGTLNIASFCKKYGKKLVYISTDFVFSGEKDSYCEENETGPVNWYGVTKLMGERVVEKIGMGYIVARISFPYRAGYEGKFDLVRFLINEIKKGEKLTLVRDQIVTPTFVDDIGAGIGFLIDKGGEGIYHLVGSQWVTPFEMAKIIADTFGFKIGKVNLVKREDFYKGRAPRPFKLKLLNDKIKKLGFEPGSFKTGLLKIKKQIL